MLKQEGQTIICKKCNVQIKCKKITFQGEERLSWRNWDGSAHFGKNVETGETEHYPIVKTALEGWQMEIEDRISRVERQVGIMWSGE